MRLPTPGAPVVGSPTTRESFAPPSAGEDPPTRYADGLVLVANDAMRARRAPWAILWMWVFETVLAAAAAWPVWTYVGMVYGSHPQGDAPLWRPGGLAAGDLLLGVEHVARTVAPLSLFFLTAASVVGLVPLTLVIGQMVFATRQRGMARFGQLMPRALAAFLPMLSLRAVTVALQLVAAATGGAVARSVSDHFAPSLGQAQATQVAGVVLLVALFATSVAGVAEDLARVAIVRFDVGPVAGVRVALESFVRAPILLYFAWLWRAAGGLFLLVTGSAIADRIGGGGGGYLVMLTLVHQSVVFGRIVLRASWLGHGLRAVDRDHRVVKR